MTTIEKVSEALSGKSEMPQEIEQELIRRVAAIEDGNVVEPLSKSDWILTAIITVLFGILPVILVNNGII